MSDLFIYIVELLLIVIAFLFAIYLISAKKSIDLEKRITRFSISSITDRPSSFFDRMRNNYEDVLKLFIPFLSGFPLLVKYSKNFNNYVYLNGNDKDGQMRIIAEKFLLAFFGVIIVIVSDVFRRHSISIIQVLFAFLVGFFIPDVFIKISDIKSQKRVEDDLFKAVLIMSNAFKSGRSIMQAVKIVSDELDGEIADEFKKVYIDLTYGLELEVAFDRLSSRIKLPEAGYLASSLAILNRTGGNVVKVFDSIEKSFYERKKLNDELKSVTALSNFVFKILMVIPFIVFLTIYVLNPSYFVPLVSTSIGKLILVIIVCLYVLYIIFVKRVIKIRE